MTQVNIDELIDRVSQKFNYDDELKDVLKKIIPSMTKGKSDDVKDLLYKTLKRVKIFVLDENVTDNKIEECKKEIFGDVNKGVKFIEEDKGEYTKTIAPGAYINEPVFDDDMNIIGRRGMLYVSRLSKYNKITELYGTTIDMSHLIHELGHGWVSENDEFVQNPDNSFINNVGACAMYSKVDKDKKEVRQEGYDGLLIEEALNSIEEERVLCDILNIESIKEIDGKGYIPSNYQGFITDIMKSYIEKFGSESFDKFRYLKDREALKDIEKAIESTEAWDIMKTSEYTEKKKAKFNRVDELMVTDGAKDLIKKKFKEYEDVYFPDNSKFSPIQKLENVFSQVYNLGTAKYNFGIFENEHNKEIYSNIMISMIGEGYVPKNQAKEIKRENKCVGENGFLGELKDSVKTVEEMASDENSINLEKNKIKSRENKELK